MQVIKGYKTMKKYLFTILITLFLSSNVYCQESLEDNTSLVIDEYELDTKLFLTDRKHKFSIDNICLDLFDFKVLKDYIDETEKSCIQRLEKRDKLCLENIDKIQSEHKKILNSFRLKYDNLLKEKDKLKIMFDTNVKLHEERITKYKWIIGTSSFLFVGTTIFLIAK